MIESLSFFQIALLGTMCLAVLVLVVYYGYYFTGLSKYEPKRRESTEPISVILAARNERENLKKNLPVLLSQTYSNYEVIVVNDGSFDGTADYLKELALTEDKLKIVTLDIDERFRKGKKFAITMGIKAASHEKLIFTDADCMPDTKNWVSEMSACFTTNNMLLGYAPLRVRKTPLGSLIAYETLHTALQYFGYAKKGTPYMGVGRNLAYTKTLFFDNKGFATHQHILSGDDDLFVQEVATKDNTEICLNSNTFISSDAPGGLAAWFKQKRRHLSTSPAYKWGFKLRLGVYSFAQLLLYIVGGLFVLLNPSLWFLAVGVLVFKWILQYIFIAPTALRLKASKVAYFVPYYDVLYTLYLLFFGIIRPFLKTKSWN